MSTSQAAVMIDVEPNQFYVAQHSKEGTVAQVAVDQQTSLKDFQRIPGIGKSLARDLWDLGYRSVGELDGEDPEAMYQAHCDQRGMKVDRCVLYAFRGAVYYASNDVHDPELLKWWNWKD